MNENQRSIIGGLFSLAVIVLALLVVQHFLFSLVWAAVMCLATWPLYQRILARLGNRVLPAALLLTLAGVCLFVVPVSFGLWEAGRQAPVVATFLADANNDGLPPPEALKHIPWVGNYLFNWWLTTLGQPRGLSHLFSGTSFSHLRSASEVLRALGTGLLHRVVDFGFAFLCLFFFYKDGPMLQRQINAIGSHCVGAWRWRRYASRVPVAVRATVNGLVLVGLGEGILLGIGYALADLPSASLWGAATGILAIIPFGAPLVFLTVAALLLAGGNATAAVAITVWGSIVLFIADHFIRPVLIGNATRLPFLAVLFGIFGGLELFGLIGLFIGPVIMALFIVLWHEPEETDREPDPETQV